MGSYFNLLFSSQDGGTMLFYTVLVLLSTIFASRAQPRAYYGTNKLHIGSFIISFLILCIPLAFTANGTDTQWYLDYFHDINSLDDATISNVEIGFQIYVAIIHYITDNPQTFIIISRFIMMILVYGAIYYMRDKSIVWLAVLGFACVVYFQFISALRNSLAYSIAFFAYALCANKKYILSILVSAIGFTIHRSSIFFMLTILAFVIFEKIDAKILKRLVIPVLIALIAIIYFKGMDLLTYYIFADSILDSKYGGYISNESTSGLMVFFVYIPIVYVYIKFKKLRHSSAELYHLNLFLAGFGFAMSILSYQIGMLARVNPFFSLPFLFYIGYCFLPQPTANNTMVEDKQTVGNALGGSAGLLLSCYWLIRFAYFVSGLFFSNGLNNFHFF